MLQGKYIVIFRWVIYTGCVAQLKKPDNFFVKEYHDEEVIIVISCASRLNGVWRGGAGRCRGHVQRECVLNWHDLEKY